MGLSSNLPFFGIPPEREILTRRAINLIYSTSGGPFQRAFFRPLLGKIQANFFT
jgi:hypothetical protein